MKNETSINVLSLFDGLSGGQIALDRANIKVAKYYASEIDKNAMTIANANYPNTIQVGDVTKLTDMQLKAMNIDLLIGGSPCTNFSFIGNRKGMTTKCDIEISTLKQYIDLKNDDFEFSGQSYLFWEFMRIKNIINPKHFLLENVKMSNKWRLIFDDAIGAESVYINSNLLSAQNRPRLYWSNIEMMEIEPKNIYLKDILDYTQPMRPLGAFMFGHYGKVQRIDIVAKLSANKANCLTTSKTHNANYYLNNEKTMMRNLTINEWEQLQTLPINYTKHVSQTQRYKAVGNGWTIDIIAHIFKSLHNTNKPIERREEPKSQLRLCEKLGKNHEDVFPPLLGLDTL